MIFTYSKILTCTEGDSVSVYGCKCSCMCLFMCRPEVNAGCLLPLSTLLRQALSLSLRHTGLTGLAGKQSRWIHLTLPNQITYRHMLPNSASIHGWHRDLNSSFISKHLTHWIIPPVPEGIFFSNFYVYGILPACLPGAHRGQMMLDSLRLKL